MRHSDEVYHEESSFEHDEELESMLEYEQQLKDELYEEFLSMAEEEAE